MREIVINTCYGGFGLSDKATEQYAIFRGLELERRDSRWIHNGYDYYYKGEFFTLRNIERDDPVLIQIVKEMGEEANDWASCLKIVEIPKDVDWQIDEYDGREWVAEKHRTWS